MNADGTGLRTVFAHDTSLQVSWSPRGLLLTYADARNSNQTGDIFVLDPWNGGSQTRLTDSPNVDDVTPDWGPA